MATTFMYVAATLPFLAVSFVAGGLGWKVLFEFVGIVLYVDIYIGSFGMFYSCVRRTSVSAAIATIITVVAIVLITYLGGNVLNSAMYMTDSIDSYRFYQAGILSCYVINPFVWIVEFAQQTFFAKSILPSMEQAGNYALVISEHLTLISVIINMVVAALMLRLASLRLRTGGRRRKHGGKLSKKEFDL